MRMMEMDNRVRMLEDSLARAMEEVADARNREVGLIGVLREVIGHLATNERGEWGVCGVLAFKRGSARLISRYHIVASQYTCIRQ